MLIGVVVMRKRSSRFPSHQVKKQQEDLLSYLKISLEPYIGAYSKSLAVNIVVKNQTPQETYF